MADESLDRSVKRRQRSEKLQPSVDSDLMARIRAYEKLARPLDPGASRRKRLRKPVLAATERFLRKIETVKGFEESESRGEALLSYPISEDGIPLDTALELLEKDVFLPGGQPASGGYLAYIPGGGLYHSALGDFMAAVTNKYAGYFFAGPGAVRMENMLVRWVADLVGYPATATGHISSGGSIANLVAITTARDAHDLKAADFARTAVYLTDQAHHSVDKALRIAGLREVQRRHVPMDAHYRMRVDALAQMIAEDRSNGLRPWLIVAAGGTTDTGAIDPLDAIADVAQRERCWFHVDAAYGGFFLLTEEGKKRLKGIERSDSAVLDPHKSLFLPYGSGMLIVRDAAPLLASQRYTGSYMQDTLRDAGDFSPSDVSPELTKHFRALRMWLPLILVGTKPFKAALEEKLLLARYFYDEVQKLGFEVGPPPDLTVVTYRWVPPGAGAEETDRVNQAIVDGSRTDGRVFLSSTMLDGKFTLRLVALHFRTHLRTIQLALRVLREQVEALSE